MYNIQSFLLIRTKFSNTSFLLFMKKIISVEEIVLCDITHVKCSLHAFQKHHLELKTNSRKRRDSFSEDQ